MQKDTAYDPSTVNIAQVHKQPSTPALEVPDAAWGAPAHMTPEICDAVTQRGCALEHVPRVNGATTLASLSVPGLTHLYDSGKVRTRVLQHEPRIAVDGLTTTCHNSTALLRIGIDKRDA